MKERPILFSGPMVRAILAGNKTMTRRPVVELSGFGRVTCFNQSDTPGYDWTFRNNRMLWNDIQHHDLVKSCPYGQPGGRLWVRETIRLCGADDVGAPLSEPSVFYAADGECPDKEAWPHVKPSIFMPRWASRILLEIVSVRVERVQEISGEDARAEGSFLGRCSCPEMQKNPHTAIESRFRQTGCYIHGDEFRHLWDSINAKRGYGWDANPWVWVVEFVRI